MAEVMLGDLLAIGQRPGAELEAWLKASDPVLAGHLTAEADRRGESPAQFLRIAVSDFLAEADDEAWSSLLSAARDAADPGATCVGRMIAFRLRLEAAS